MKTTKTMGMMAAAVGVLALNASAGAQEFKGFPDVPKNHWAAQAVNDLAGRGILNGYPAEGSGGKLKAKPQTQTTLPAAAKTATKKPATDKTARQK